MIALLLDGVTLEQAFGRRRREQTSTSEVMHQRTVAERPWRDRVGRVDAIDERAERWRRHGDDVADDVREALPRREPVLCRREHRAEEQHEAVRILMVRADRLRDEIERIAADLR